MKIDEVADAGVEIVKQALLDCLPERGIRSLAVQHWNEDGPQIRFTAVVDGQEVTFGLDIEPFLRPGSDAK